MIEARTERTTKKGKLGAAKLPPVVSASSPYLRALVSLGAELISVAKVGRTENAHWMF